MIKVLERSHVCVVTVRKDLLSGLPRSRVSEEIRISKHAGSKKQRLD